MIAFKIALINSTVALIICGKLLIKPPTNVLMISTAPLRIVGRFPLIVSINVVIIWIAPTTICGSIWTIPVAIFCRIWTPICIIVGSCVWIAVVILVIIVWIPTNIKGMLSKIPCVIETMNCNPIPSNWGIAFNIAPPKVPTISNALLTIDWALADIPWIIEFNICIPAFTTSGNVFVIPTDKWTSNCAPELANIGIWLVIPFTKLPITLGACVTTVAIILSIWLPNWLFIIPNPATTNPKIAAGPTDFIAIANTLVNPVVIVDIAFIPTSVDFFNPLLIPEPIFMNLSGIFFDTLSNASPSSWETNIPFIFMPNKFPSTLFLIGAGINLFMLSTNVFLRIFRLFLTLPIELLSPVTLLDNKSKPPPRDFI